MSTLYILVLSTFNLLCLLKVPCKLTKYIFEVYFLYQSRHISYLYPPLLYHFCVELDYDCGWIFTVFPLNSRPLSVLVVLCTSTFFLLASTDLLSPWFRGILDRYCGWLSIAFSLKFLAVYLLRQIMHHGNNVKI